MGEIKINNIVYGTDNASSIIYKDTTVEEKLNTIPVFDPSDNQHVEANQYDYLTYGHIVDNLNSTEDNKVLSAKQGKALNDRIESVTEKNSEDIEDLMITVNTLKNIIPDVERLTAKTLEYDDSKTNLGVNNVQDAIDEQDKNLSDASNYTLSELFAMCPSSKPRVFFCNWDSPIAAMMNKQNAFLTINDWTCIATTYTGERYQANAENLEFTLCGLRTGVDANGNYGYYKDGADTVTPFKKGNNIESPKAKISGVVTSVTCNNCIIGNTYMIIYAPWSGAGYSQAASYLSVSSYSGCEAPTQLYTLNDGYRSTVGVFKVKATSTTFKIQWHTGGGGYIIVCE